MFGRMSTYRLYMLWADLATNYEPQADLVTKQNKQNTDTGTPIPDRS